MSAFLPLATTERKSLEVRFVPSTDMARRFGNRVFSGVVTQPRDFGVQGACLVAAESNLEYRLKALADLFWVILRFPEPTLTAVA